MSEEEAKTKWCPFVRAIGANGAVAVSGNAALDVSNKPPTLEHAGFNCIGSACMAWRSLGRHLEPGEGLQPGESYPLGGFCGLAGKP